MSDNGLLGITAQLGLVNGFLIWICLTLNGIYKLLNKKSATSATDPEKENK